MDAADRPIVRALQHHLTHADPGLIDAAIDGPFLGFVALDGDRPVGYSIAFPGRPLVLSELVVAPDARRDGHGRRLLEAVASNAENVCVTTPLENRAAIRFYLDSGFEIEERHVEYYADGTDALGLLRRK